MGASGWWTECRGWRGTGEGLVARGPTLVEQGKQHAVSWCQHDVSIVPQQGCLLLPSHCGFGQSAVYCIQRSVLPSCFLMHAVKCWLPKLQP